DNGQRIFNVLPYTPILDGQSTSIFGLTLEGGAADTGGAILDSGPSLTLRSDVFKNNRAVGVPGGDGLGGAVAILGEATTNLAVNILDGRFVDNAAVGGAGKAGPSGNVDGGAGKGGAVYVDAGNSQGLSLVVSDTHFIGDLAKGGRGGDGSAGANGSVGGV